VKLTPEATTKIYSTMRSLYRLSELQSLGSPEVLIDTEKTLLSKHLSKLNAEEILFVATNFNEYMSKQKVESAIQDEVLAEDFSKYLRNLN